VFAHDGTSFKPVQRQWVNVNGTWRAVEEVYVRSGGSWNLVAGSLPAVFNTVGGSFGVDSRPKAPEFIPPSFDSGGGGGGDNTTGPGTTGRGDDGNVFGGDNYSEPTSPAGAGNNADGSTGTENQG
jgi:hypothetical protein